MSIQDSRLLLELGEPGMDNSRKIVSLFDASTIVPLHVVRVDLQDKAKETLDAFRSASDASQIVREWIESSAAFEITIAGDPDDFLKKLEAFLSTKPELKARAEIVQTEQFLAEPEVVFSLRDDVRWHDGEPFTSRDVAFTYRAIMDDATASPRKPDFLYILRIETPDPHTVRVIYRKPYSPGSEQLDDRNAARSHPRRQTAGLVGSQLQSQSRGNGAISIRRVENERISPRHSQSGLLRRAGTLAGFHRLSGASRPTRAPARFRDPAGGFLERRPVGGRTLRGR